MTTAVDAGLKLGILGQVPPDAYAPATVETAWIDAGQWASLLALVSAGALGTDATLAAKIEKSHGADDLARDGNAVDLLGASITTLTQAGTDDSGKVATIAIKPRELGETEAGTAYTHVRLSLTIAAAASDVAGYVLGLEPRYGPAASAAFVAEQV